jgi:hypothetical protein
MAEVVAQVVRNVRRGAGSFPAPHPEKATAATAAFLSKS